jgi:hypothetical protein
MAGQGEGSRQGKHWLRQKLDTLGKFAIFNFRVSIWGEWEGN